MVDIILLGHCLIHKLVIVSVLPLSTLEIILLILSKFYYAFKFSLFTSLLKGLKVVSFHYYQASSHNFTFCFMLDHIPPLFSSSLILLQAPSQFSFPTIFDFINHSRTCHLQHPYNVIMKLMSVVVCATSSISFTIAHNF